MGKLEIFDSDLAGKFPQFLAASLDFCVEEKPFMSLAQHSRGGTALLTIDSQALEGDWSNDRFVAGFQAARESLQPCPETLGLALRLEIEKGPPFTDISLENWQGTGEAFVQRVIGIINDNLGKEVFVRFDSSGLCASREGPLRMINFPLTPKGLPAAQIFAKDLLPADIADQINFPSQVGHLLKTA